MSTTELKELCISAYEKQMIALAKVEGDKGTLMATLKLEMKEVFGLYSISNFLIVVVIEMCKCYEIILFLSFRQTPSLYMASHSLSHSNTLASSLYLFHCPFSLYLFLSIPVLPLSIPSHFLSISSILSISLPCPSR
jgi:hypothetical protein